MTWLIESRFTMPTSITDTTGALLVGIMLAWPTPAHAQSVQDPAAAGEHRHAHAGHEVVALDLDDGHRWKTDAPLRAGMERIREAVVAANAQAERAGGLDERRAGELAAAVEDAIVYMVSHCQLEPAADANLHILLAKLSGAAAAIRANREAADGLPMMFEALAVYPRYFEHLGWEQRF
jgi:hypothetical protein